jgi:hypothetical protein
MDCPTTARAAPSTSNPGVSEVAASLHANIALHKGFAQVLTGTRRKEERKKARRNAENNHIKTCNHEMI